MAVLNTALLMQLYSRLAMPQAVYLVTVFAAAIDTGTSRCRNLSLESRDSAAPSCLALIAIRSDAYERLQTAGKAGYKAARSQQALQNHVQNLFLQFFRLAQKPPALEKQFACLKHIPTHKSLGKWQKKLCL